MEEKNLEIKRGQVWLTKTNNEVVILQNNVGNKYSPTTIVINKKNSEINTINKTELAYKKYDKANDSYLRNIEKNIMQALNNSDYLVGYIDFGTTVGIGSVQGGNRPAIVVNDICIPLTTKIMKRNLPTHVGISANSENGVKYNSIVLCEQIIAKNNKNLNKSEFFKVSDKAKTKIKTAILISLDIK